MISGLKQKILRLEQQCKEKDNTIKYGETVRYFPLPFPSCRRLKFSNNNLVICLWDRWPQVSPVLVKTYRRLGGQNREIINGFCLFMLTYSISHLSGPESGI